MLILWFVFSTVFASLLPGFICVAERVGDPTHPPRGKCGVVSFKVLGLEIAIKMCRLCMLSKVNMFFAINYIYTNTTKINPRGNLIASQKNRQKNYKKSQNRKEKIKRNQSRD
jgi:hypothetical protein